MTHISMVKPNPVVLVVFISFLTTCCASAVPKACGSGRIVGGEDANLGDIPYQIQVMNGNYHMCGGVLVVVNNTQIVLTAAHCVAEEGFPLRQNLVAGDIQLNEGGDRGQKRKVAKSIVHENTLWDPREGVGINDIGILVPESPFNLSDPTVAPIALPKSMQNTTGLAEVSGWGPLEEGSAWASGCLRHVNVTIVPDDICWGLYGDYIYDPMICAGDLEDGGKDRCWSDAGGPLRSLEGNYLAGIISWGKVSVPPFLK